MSPPDKNLPTCFFLIFGGPTPKKRERSRERTWTAEAPSTNFAHFGGARLRRRNTLINRVSCSIPRAPFMNNEGFLSALNAAHGTNQLLQIARNPPPATAPPRAIFFGARTQDPSAPASASAALAYCPNSCSLSVMATCATISSSAGSFASSSRASAERTRWIFSSRDIDGTPLAALNSAGSRNSPVRTTTTTTMPRHAELVRCDRQRPTVGARGQPDVAFPDLPARE